MKKQLFTGLIATALIVTTVPMPAFAAMPNAVAVAQKTTTTTSGAAKATDSAITTSGTAITATDSAIKATDSAIKATDAAITTGEEATTAPAIDSEAKAPTVLAPISLTLDGAYKKMAADSPQSILAKYSLDNDLAVGRGYSENLSKLNKAEKDPDSWGVDTSSKISLRACRNFANAQAPKNHESTMNSLKSQTYEMYYTYKYTEAQVQVAKDNLARVQAVYNSTMLQYKVGKVSKLDTLTAETSLNEAKDNYQKAVNGMSQMKMNFNLFMGYNIHQPVTLTDSLNALPLPDKNVETAVNEALKNRNEISEAKYRADITQISLNNVKDYPSSSATYKKAKVAVDMAQEGLKSAPGQVEIDVRTKDMDMKQKNDAVTSGKISYENSKEAARLGQLQFDNGFITVTDLAGLNLNAFNTQQAYYKAILDYNLAVNEYELASGVGTKTAAIQ